MVIPWGPVGVTRRMIAHWVVLAAAALTTLVAATVAAALAVFAGQVLPQVVQYNLVRAQQTALSVTALVSGPGQAATGSAALRSRIAATMPGTPFSYDEALWSDLLALTPGALPAAPAGSGKGNTPFLQAAAMNDVASHATLVAGHWPAAPGGGQPQPISAALPAAAAARLHVSVGDVLRLRVQSTSAPVSFDITGIFTPRSAGSYWQLSYIPASGASAGSGSTTYGPLVVSQAAFGATLPLLSGSWVAQPDMTAFTEADLGPVSARVAALAKSLPNSAFLAGAQLATSLPSVLAGAARNVTVARSTLVISALELLVLAIAALLVVARLLATQREADTALLIARGATRPQLAWLTAAEVVPLAAVVSVAGGLAGIELAGVLASAGPLGAAGIRLAGGAGSLTDALGAAITVAVIAVAALLIPGLTATATAARARRGRQARAAGAARAGLDVALLALAVLAGWQLRYYSAASSNGTAGIDPVLALAPALALAAGSVILLRLLPLAARAADWLAARSRRFTVSLASWQFGRMPVRQGSAALLLTMAVATGTLALAQHASWTRSVSDQATFANGAAVQVDPPAPLSPGGVRALTTAKGVTHAMAVAVVPQAYPGEVIALDAAQAAQVVQFRSGQASPGSLFRAITPSSGPQGTALPGAVIPAPQPGARAGPLRLTAELGPSAAASGLGPVQVTLTVLDATGAAYQVPAGSLAADGRPHVLSATLSGGQPRYPLRVVSIAASFQLPPQPVADGVTLTISGLSLANWTENLTTDLPPEPPGSVSLPPAAEKTSFTGGQSRFTFSPGNTIPGVPPNHGELTLTPPVAGDGLVIPAIATKAFMDANSLAVGGEVAMSFNGPQVQLRIVAEVPSFPTVTAPGGAVIADLGSLEESIARKLFPPLAVNQWWLATAGGGVPAAVPASVPAGTVITSAAGRATAAARDTLSAAPQLALLALAAAAALLAITGFWVSIAADVRRRRGEAALLAALGVPQRGVATALCLEKLLVSLPSAVLGLLLGALLADLLVPAVTLNPAAQRPVPAAVTVYDLPQAIPLALAVAVLPAAIAALAALRRPDPAAELRAAEAA